jgi:signal peptidase
VIAAARLKRGIVGFVLLAVLGVWFVVFRPQILGGPASYILVGGTSMEPGLHAGTLVVTTREPAYRVGDVIVYRVPDGDPAAGQNVIHRIVGGDGIAGFVVRGDNTNAPDIWKPTWDQILGRAWLVIPGTEGPLLFLRSPIVLASVMSAAAVYVALGLLYRSDPAIPTEGDAS